MYILSFIHFISCNYCENIKILNNSYQYFFFKVKKKPIREDNSITQTNEAQRDY